MDHDQAIAVRDDEIIARYERELGHAGVRAPLQRVLAFVLYGLAVVGAAWGCPGIGVVTRDRALARRG